MKFGENLRQNMVAEWAEHYLDYDKLKSIIRELEASQVNKQRSDLLSISSLTIGQQTDAAAQPIERESSPRTQENFFSLLDEQMKKIEQFTKTQVRKDVYEKI